MSEENGLPDYYAILHVRSNVTAAQIKNAFRREINYWHPDRWLDAPQEAKERALMMTVKVNEAYETLSDLAKKATYDEFYLEWKSCETFTGSTGKSNKQAPDRTLEGRLAQEGLEIIDKRPQGGTLWVVGSLELSDFFDGLRSEGFNFVPMSRGGRAVKHRPSWYLKQ